MRVLVVKTSSLGDVIHTLPALTDAHLAVNDIQFDWVVEKGFAEIPAWHKAVDRVIISNVRQWRKSPIASRQLVGAFITELRSRTYDLVIDAQGLMKSALITRFAKGPRAGLNLRSVREPLACAAYQHHYDVPKGQHAIARTRQLFASALGYAYSNATPEYRLKTKWQPESNSITLLTGTTWATKHYPEHAWRELIKLITAQGLSVQLPWGSEQEHQRVQRLSEVSPLAKVLPRCQLGELATIICSGLGVVALDSGLSHLTAACGVPCVTLYASTDPALTGALGKHQTHLSVDYPCAPCLKRQCSKIRAPQENPPCWNTIEAGRIWSELVSKISREVSTSPFKIDCIPLAHLASLD
jgi:heptosyltransferase-1